MYIYIIQPGDSIYTIAKKYGVSPEKIIADNALQNMQRLMVGQAIVIMKDNIKHTVKKGESLYLIAKKYETTIDALLEANNIKSPYQIDVGDAIIIPSSAKKLGDIIVNGYVFPNINPSVLEKTLPHLTYISIFSYEVKPDGNLVEINDEPIIKTAMKKNVAPLMVINNIIQGKGFDSDLIHTILNDENAQNNLINNILKTMSAKGYYGLNIDFEYVYPDDKENYNNFLTKITKELQSQGYIVTTSIAPKTSTDQPGLLYEAHDYAHHGKTVDYVIIMTYEWGYLYGPAWAVAPADQVKTVLDYAVSLIPRQKILMGIPNYGYDWTLPFVKGSSAKTLTNTEALALAAKVGAQIFFDSKTQAPFFNYYDDKKQEHVVWFEDARSIQAKLLLVDKYNLGGVSYWTLNNFFPQNWMILESMYNVKKVV